MRLTTTEQIAIKKAFIEVFGGGKIYLFGSRVDDTKRGGDIDLYLVPTKKFDDERERKIKFLIKLDEYIGEQKIDVVLAKDKNRLIEQEALKEGVELRENIIRLQKYLNECNKHKIRIEKAYDKVKHIFPLSPSRYEKLNDDEIEAIDQYLFRFAKLQDTLGQRVFKSIVLEYVEDISNLTFIDILNKLVQIGVLKDIKIWQKLRTIRNDISHQYDDESEDIAEALNNIFAYKEEILNIYQDIYLFCYKKFEKFEKFEKYEKYEK